MRDAREVIIKPMVTEKTAAMSASRGAYAFLVSRDSNKIEIKRAVEQLFDVKVRGVRTMVYRGKKRRVVRAVGRRPWFKKAVVTLAAGDSIDLYEGS